LGQLTPCSRRLNCAASTAVFGQQPTIFVMVKEAPVCYSGKAPSVLASTPTEYADPVTSDSLVSDRKTAMKEKSSKHNTAKRRRRLLLFAAVAVVVAVTAITVISRQKGRATQAANREATKAAASTTRTFVTRRVGNQDIHLDKQTGEIKPLTPEEAQKLANGLAPMLDKSTDGLVEVHHNDGSVSMDLEGRFQNVAVARINKNGIVEQSCVDNPGAAAKFFGIDRKRIENAPTARKRVNTTE